MQAEQRFLGLRAWARSSLLAEHWSGPVSLKVVMGDEENSGSNTSLPKYLEQLSGDGKAIGVLTSGGDAQGARLPAISPASQARAGGEGERRGLQRKVGRNVG